MDEGSAVLGFGQLLADHTEPALTMLVVADGGIQLIAAEGRPVFGGDEDFGVCKLPEEKITDAEFTARSDQKVRIGNPGRGQIRRHETIVDCRRIQRARDRIVHDPFHGARDLPAAAVAQGENQRKSGVVPGLLNVLEELVLNFRRKRGDVADCLDADVVPVEAIGLILESVQQQAHQEGHFLLRTLPVLGRKRIQCQELNPELTTGLNGVADRLHPFAVPCNPRKAAAFRPAPVAVHDDRNVAGNLTGASQRLLHSLIFAGGLLRTYAQEFNSPICACERTSDHLFEFINVPEFPSKVKKTVV